MELDNDEEDDGAVAGEIGSIRLSCVKVCVCVCVCVCMCVCVCVCE